MWACGWAGREDEEELRRLSDVRKEGVLSGTPPKVQTKRPCPSRGVCWNDSQIRSHLLLLSLGFALAAVLVSAFCSTSFL